MSSRTQTTETVSPVDRVSETGQPSAGTTNPLREQYVAELFSGKYDFHQGTPGERPGPTERTGDRTQPGNPYDYHQGPSDRVGPPAPERTSDRTKFEMVRNAKGEVDAIKFGDGTTLQRTGPKEWQATRDGQPLSAQDLQAFAGANALGFPLCAKDGKILGNITQKDANGDVQYDARNTDLNIYVTRKPDGSKDLRNYNDYSRTKIGADGREQDKDYWDGYQWRHGTAEKLPSGQTQITFNQNERQPAGAKAWPKSVVRDGGTDSLTVQHNDQLVMHANWREQKLITRNAGRPEDVKYYDGENWRHGRELVLPGGGSANMRKVEFTDGTGPQSVTVDTTSGDIKDKQGRMSEPTQEEREQKRLRDEQERLRREETERRRAAPRPTPQYVNPTPYIQPYCPPNGGRRG